MKKSLFVPDIRTKLHIFKVEGRLRIYVSVDPAVKVLLILAGRKLFFLCQNFGQCSTVSNSSIFVQQFYICMYIRDRWLSGFPICAYLYNTSLNIS